MLILDGKRRNVPGLTVYNWLDTSGCPRTTDLSPRTTWVRAIVLHTVHGKVGPLRPGGKDTGRDLKYAQYQARTPRSVSWDFTVDLDGSVAQSNDPVDYFTWHATSVNKYTIGIELVQEMDGSVYEEQLAKTVLLVGALCDHFGIQKQIPWRGDGPIDGLIPRIEKGNGVDVVGVYGHRNQTRNRGKGDPGDHVFRALKAAGFDGFDFARDEDKTVWRARQKAVDIEPKKCDGIPGPGTRAALEQHGYRAGVWVNGQP